MILDHQWNSWSRSPVSWHEHYLGEGYSSSPTILFLNNFVISNWFSFLRYIFLFHSLWTRFKCPSKMIMAMRWNWRFFVFHPNKTSCFYRRPVAIIICCISPRKKLLMLHMRWRFPKKSFFLIFKCVNGGIIPNSQSSKLDMSMSKILVLDQAHMRKLRLWISTAQSNWIAFSRWTSASAYICWKSVLWVLRDCTVDLEG